MPVMLEDGKILLVDGKVAADEECCCGSDGSGSGSGSGSGGGGGVVPCPCPSFACDDGLSGVGGLEFTLLCDGFDHRRGDESNTRTIGGVCWIFVSGTQEDQPWPPGAQRYNDVLMRCTSDGWLVEAYQHWYCDPESYGWYKSTAVIPCNGEGLPEAGAVDLQADGEFAVGENYCGIQVASISVEITVP